jgi:hypothetical protein
MHTPVHIYTQKHEREIFLRQVLALLPRLVLNSWPQVILLSHFPELLGLQLHTLQLALDLESLV